MKELVVTQAFSKKHPRSFYIAGVKANDREMCRVVLYVISH